MSNKRQRHFPKFFYSDDGIQKTDFTSSALAIQDNGKILVTGDSALARLNTDGSLDNTFSNDGKLQTDFRANSVAVEGDGKIVVVGSGRDNDLYETFAIARYNPDGSPDKSFSGDGK